MFFRCMVRIEAAGIHITEMILFRKVLKICVKALARINKAGGGGKAGSRTNDHRIHMSQRFP